MCKFTCYSIECRDTQVFNLGDVIKLAATARIYEISVTTILRNFQESYFKEGSLFSFLRSTFSLLS